MPKGDKYLGLKRFLQNADTPLIKLSFNQIEKIISDTLPPSAYNHAEVWWSNDKSHSQAVSWLDAGYLTDCVSDTYKDKCIIFIKDN